MIRDERAAGEQAAEKVEREERKDYEAPELVVGGAAVDLVQGSGTRGAVDGRRWFRS
jgi:hypothetical protein